MRVVFELMHATKVGNPNMLILVSHCTLPHAGKHGKCLLLTVRSRDGKTRPGPLAETGRAGPENPGPRALRAETGLIIFYLRFLCALCAGRLVVTR